LSGPPKGENMNVRVLLTSAVVFAAGSLLMAGSASAQFGGQVNVSNVIEGGVGGVSAARCGSNMVVGFADVESTRANSYDGVANSTNGGASFTDRGTLPVPPPNSFGPYVLGTNFNNPIGASNPSVACANSTLFYYASVYSTAGVECSNAGNGCTAISVSKSTNGGASWGLPVIASIQGSDVFTYVSPSMAVDPTNPLRLYVAYINWSLGNFPFPDCFMDIYSLDVVASSDGGKTWTQPQHIDHACNNGGSNPALNGTLASPNIIVSPGGKVYVADEFIGQSGNPNAIHFQRSVNFGSSFSAPIKVSTHATSNALPQLAVDRTSLSSRGEIYLTWSGAPSGTYTDILVSDSVNFGQSFSFPRPISPTPVAGAGRFQSNPVIAVDKDGQVADCFYSTPSNRPTSSSVYSYHCAISFNRAASWTPQQLVSSAPVGYDAVAGDFLLGNDGFFTAFEFISAGQRHVVGQSADH
jgi:hypothetical protein